MSHSNVLRAGTSSVYKIWSYLGLYQHNRVIAVAHRRYLGIKSSSKLDKHDLGKTSNRAAYSRQTDENTPSNSYIEDNIQDIVKNSKGKDMETNLNNLIALGKLQNLSNGIDLDEQVDVKTFDPLVQGHKYELPELPIPKNANFKYRDDPVVQQVANLLMRDGKKGVAQRLRTAPPPTFNPARPLIPGHPPAHHLPLNPVEYLTLALDSVAPLLRIRSQRGAAGGGASLPIPVPLRKRQRRRQAVMWILESVNKRQNRSSGRGTLAQRFADEIIGVVEGKSTAWDKRLVVHKAATVARNNINFRQRRR